MRLGVKRILVVKLSSLGDLFHALPAVHRIRAATGATMDWVCHDIYVDLVRLFEPVERVISFPRRSFLKNGREFLRDLRKESYDLALDFQGLLKSALVARGARANRRIGPSFPREGANLFYNAVAGPRNKQRHAVDECLDTARYLGVPDEPVEFPMKIPASTFNFLRPCIGLLPCSRRAEKNWPVDRFAETARALRERTGSSFAVLGSPADAEPCAELVRRIGLSAQNLCGRTTLVELVGLIHALDLLITVDSGPMHIAAAVGTPTVALFGPTDPVRTGPYGDIHRVLRCGDSLLDLQPGPVIAAALAQLAERNGRTARNSGR